MLTQVRQFGSQVLHILLSDRSPYSFEFVQLKAHCLVLLFPKVGVGHIATHEVPLRYSGDEHDLQFVKVVSQVKQLGSQVLQILLSKESPY